MKSKNENDKVYKSSLICKKENAISSLFEVEHFLCSLKKVFNTISLYRILK